MCLFDELCTSALFDFSDVPMREWKQLLTVELKITAQTNDVGHSRANLMIVEFHPMSHHEKFSARNLRLPQTNPLVHGNNKMIVSTVVVTNSRK